MASLRVAAWNIAGARREQTNQVDLDAVVAGVRALGRPVGRPGGRPDPGPQRPQRTNQP